MYYHDIRTYNNYLYLFLRLFNFNSKIKLYNIMNIISSNYNPFAYYYIIYDDGLIAGIFVAKFNESFIYIQRIICS